MLVKLISYANPWGAGLEIVLPDDVDILYIGVAFGSANAYMNEFTLKAKKPFNAPLIQCAKASCGPVNLSFLHHAPLFFFQNGAKSGFEMCFGPSTLGAGAITRLESGINKFTPHCVCRPTKPLPTTRPVKTVAQTINWVKATSKPAPTCKAYTYAKAGTGATLLKNGGFEEGWSMATPWHYAAAGKNALPGWKVTLGDIDFGDYTTDGHCAGKPCAAKGVSMLDICGTKKGAIEQTFAVQPNTVYTFSIQYSSHATCSGSGTIIKAQVRLDDTAIQVLTHRNENSWDNLRWTTYTFDFKTANTNTIKLSLASIR